MKSRLVGLAVVLVLWVELAHAQFRPITKVLHANETGNADGETISIDGASSISLTVTISGTATVTFEGSQDQAAWTSVACVEVGDIVFSPILEAITSMTVRCNVAGLVLFRARTSGNTGTVTVSATASPAVMGGGGGAGGGSGSEADTLDTVFDRGKVIDGANSLANAVRIGDGVTPLCLYTDSVQGPRVRPCTASNIRTYIENGFSWGLFDVAGDADMFVVTPGAATMKEKLAYKPGYYPLKSVFVSAWAMHGDGTNCPARPTVVTISNQPYPTFICTENNSSRLKFMLPMRPNWDGGVIYIKPIYAQTAADTGSVALEVAAACRAFGTAFNGTYGTEVDVDDAAVAGSGAVEGTLSAAVTPNGTCAPGHILFVYIDVDATDNPTTAAATLNFIGADVIWSETSPSH